VRHAVFLAWRNLNAGRLRSAILVCCLTVAVSLPIVLHVVVGRFQKQLTQRAAATPLIVGATGSRFDLTLHTLYFEADAPSEISMREVETIRSSHHARPIPIFAKFRAEGFRIVGTTTEYFELRRLTIARGKNLTRIGDCVLGAAVAVGLGRGPGDRMTSEPENVFDSTGSYPLRMKVNGILAETNSPDDSAIFVSLETAWIIAGRGHGHRNPGNEAHEPADGEQEGSFIPVEPFTEVTDENVGSFHFHGKREDLPITAIIVDAPDERSETLLIGRYLARDDVTILEPPRIIEQLMQLVFRVERLLDVGAVVLLSTTATLVLLVFALSLRLRQSEIQTLFKLGCSRFMIARILLAEVLLIAVVSAVLIAAVTGVAFQIGPELLEQTLTRT
jgi:putative ABC transport system permease protein